MKTASTGSASARFAVAPLHPWLHSTAPLGRRDLDRADIDDEMRAEVRFDNLAGCLRTPRGGSARQIVMVIADGRVRFRWMSPREYARLQGAPDFTLAENTIQSLFGFGDGVCVPVVRWVDVNVLTPIYEDASAQRGRVARNDKATKNVTA